MKLLDLFRSGMDTLQISQHLGGDISGWPESRVYRVLNAERREERTPVTWKDVAPKPKAPRAPAPRGKITYAGHDGMAEWDRV